MRFLQVSDVHLRPESPERMEALVSAIEVAHAETATTLLIPGDLFDSPVAAEALRPEVRSVLEAFKGHTVITPGNHDQAAYAEETDYGERTTVLRSTPFQEHVLRDGTDGSLRIIGAPYAPRTTLGQALAGLEIDDPSRTILMAHGTLAGAVPYGDSEGDEEAYFPITVGDLRGRFAYAALGHLHARPTFDGWTSSKAWGYSGSPVAITRGETGPRHVVLVEMEAGVGVRDVRPIALDTDYWEAITVRALPWEDPDGILTRLNEELALLAAESSSRCGVRIRVEGWIDGNEGDFRALVEQQLTSLAPRFRVIDEDVAIRTIASVLSAHPELDVLLKRVRQLATKRAVDDETLRMAIGLLVDAAGGGGL